MGNKKDLLTEDELLAVKNKVSLDIDLITSAKENENVENAFLKLAANSLK